MNDNRFAIASMLVCSAVESIDNKQLHSTLIREGVKVWLSRMSPEEIEQIAAMTDQGKLITRRARR